MSNKKDKADWTKRAEAELRNKSVNELTRTTPEKITVEPLYTAADLDGLNHTDSLPGEAPFTRGIRATMYTNRPWTIRQYAGFSTAEETNAFFRKALAAGQKGLSVAFDLATHRGYDSDHQRVRGDVGKAGVAIDTVEDMKMLFDKIPLDQMSVSMTMNGAVLPVLASFIVAGEEQDVPQAKLSGTIQNDILKEFMVRNTYIYPPAPSMRIVADIIAHTATQMPKFNSISISGYHMQEAGANLVQELAFTLADGLEYVRAATDRGLDVDDFAPRLSFFFCIGMNFFMEAAKLRAARTLWARWMQKLFSPTDERSLMLRTHCQTSGASLSEQDPYNNIIRTTVEAMAATLGGTQSLHTNSFDEAISLPTDFSARIARNTQLILQHETGIADTVDPLAGSYYVETLTAELIEKADALITEIQDMGGMTIAVQDGLPKREIEKMATARQARVDSGQDVIVGVNKYKLEDEAPVDILNIDNDAVRESQTERLRQIRANRDETAVTYALQALKAAAKDDNQNLLAATIDAMRARASVGEVSDALEEVFGRFAGQNETVRNIYKAAYGESEQLDSVHQSLHEFVDTTSETPVLYMAKLGQDGHDRGAKVIASAFGDFGMDVRVGDLFQTPEEAADTAIEMGAHVIGVSSLAAGHKTLLPQLIAALKDREAEDILVICGGIIPQQDYRYLYDAGVAAIFGPGTAVPDAACETLNKAADHLKRMHNYRQDRLAGKRA
ncbi:MAG: methylmalonyl-CoA mutase [Candidatus Puniceispirillaceae bacterium]